jgi:peptide deformylase
MIKSIITDRKLLSIPCEEVKETDDISGILMDLQDTLKTVKGYGLSGNQIGYKKCVAIVNMPEVNIALINPKILEKSERIVIRGEGCLSFAGITFATDRYNQITYQNGLNKEISTVSGLLAVVIQHEVDHLNGITFFSRKHKKQ